MTSVQQPAYLSFPLGVPQGTMLPLEAAQGIAPQVMHDVLCENWDDLTARLTAHGIPLASHADAAAECLIGAALGGAALPELPLPRHLRSATSLVRFELNRLRTIAENLGTADVRLPFDRVNAASIPIASARKLMRWAAGLAWDGKLVDLRHMLRRHGVHTPHLTAAAVQLIIGAVLNYSPEDRPENDRRRQGAPRFSSTTFRPGTLTLDLDVNAVLQVVRNATGVEFFLGLDDYDLTGNPWDSGVRFGG